MGFVHIEKHMGDRAASVVTQACGSIGLPKRCFGLMDP
jgi:hypothetical protein